MGPDRIEIRAMRAFGLVCGTSPTGSPVRVQKVGRFFEDGDSVMVFADNDPDISRDDTIIPGVVGSIDKTQTCPGGDVAQSLTVPALTAALVNDTCATRCSGQRVHDLHLWIVHGERRRLSGPRVRRDDVALGGATRAERSLIHLRGLRRNRHY